MTKCTALQLKLYFTLAWALRVGHLHVLGVQEVIVRVVIIWRDIRLRSTAEKLGTRRDNEGAVGHPESMRVIVDSGTSAASAAKSRCDVACMHVMVAISCIIVIMHHYW